MKNEKRSDFSQAIIKKEQRMHLFGYEIERQLAKKAGRRTLLAKRFKFSRIGCYQAACF